MTIQNLVGKWVEVYFTDDDYIYGQMTFEDGIYKVKSYSGLYDFTFKPEQVARVIAGGTIILKYDGEE